MRVQMGLTLPARLLSFTDYSLMQVYSSMYTDPLWYSIPQAGASSDRVGEGWYPLKHPPHHHQLLCGLLRIHSTKKTP